jgi:hypothetical protein
MPYSLFSVFRINLVVEVVDCGEPFISVATYKRIWCRCGLTTRSLLDPAQHKSSKGVSGFSELTNTTHVGFYMLLVQKKSIAWNNTSHVGFYMLLVQKKSIVWNNTSHVGFYMLLVQKKSIAWNNTSHVGFYMLLVQKKSIAWNNTSHLGFYMLLVQKKSIIDLKPADTVVGGHWHFFT